MRVRLALVVAGVVAVVVGVGAYDWRAGVVLAGVGAVVAGLFWDDGEAAP